MTEIIYTSPAWKVLITNYYRKPLALIACSLLLGLHYRSSKAQEIWIKNNHKYVLYIVIVHMFDRSIVIFLCGLKKFMIVCSDLTVIGIVIWFYRINDFLTIALYVTNSVDVAQYHLCVTGWCCCCCLQAISACVSWPLKNSCRPSAHCPSSACRAGKTSLSLIRWCSSSPLMHTISYQHILT